jgi:putative ABC transport system permease protein
MQSNTLSKFPISITTTEQGVEVKPMRHGGEDREKKETLEEFTKKDVIYRYDKNANVKMHTNVLTDDYLDYISKMEKALPHAVNAISYKSGVEMNLLAKGDDSVVNFQSSESNGEGQNQGMMPNRVNRYWQEMPDNEKFILSVYDLIGKGSRLPAKKNEIALVVDEFNSINKGFFEKLGIVSEADEYKLNDFIGKKLLKVVPNDDFYIKSANGIYKPATPSEYQDLFTSDNGLELTVTGILRVKEDAESDYFSEGLIYTTALTDYVVEDAKDSEIAKAQAESDTDVISTLPFPKEDAKEKALIRLGALTTPTGVDIYPTDFASKDEVKDFLDKYNKGKKDKNQVIYNDLAETITGVIGKMLSTVTYVLIGFAAISLLVSTIMIGIITYVSVIERTKEIGILRSVGARKKDVSRVFNAETLIVGFAAGLLGVGISYLLTIPINAVIFKLTEIEGLANLDVLSALLLIVGSMVLTLIAGLVPARMAAKKDPVEALRTE